MSGNTSVYFHIPFCTRKCDYCHFYVLPNKEDLHALLMEGLQLEWQLKAPLFKESHIETVYFGGGTPALLGPKRIEEILNWIDRDVGLGNCQEITLEANPENITKNLMQDFQHAGINRASIGIQSFDDNLLQTLSRTHGAEKAKRAVHDTFEANIKNISIDLMFDLPGQTMDQWQHSLNEASALPISHLSLYNLTFEPHTVYYKKRDLLMASLPSEEVSHAMYKAAQSTLSSANLQQYEISAFAKEGFRSNHNVGYWTGRPFQGLGPSAFSFWDGRRFRNVSNIHKYIKGLNETGSAVDFEEKLDKNALKRELLSIGLRLIEGVSIEEFEKRWGKLEKETLEAVKALVQQGYLCFCNERLCMTPEGILQYDTIASELV